MKLASFLCCQNIATNPENGEILIFQPLQNIALVSVPSTYSFSISIGLVEMDKGGKDCFGLSIIDPDGVIVQNIENIKIPSAPENIAEDDSLYSALMNLDLRNMVFNSTGLYRVVFSGSLTCEFPLWVTKNAH